MTPLATQRISLIVPDGVVILDGAVHQITYAVPEGVRVLHWDVVAAQGHVEYADERLPETIQDLSAFQPALEQVQAHLNSIPPSPLHVLGAAGAWTVDIDRARVFRIATLKAACQTAITTAYPLWKQLNIERLASGYTQADRDSMAQFIDGCRSRCDSLEAQVQQAATAEEIDSVVW